MSYLTPKVIQRISKEITDLHKTPIDGIDVNQEIDDLSEISAVIHGPTSTPYEGGQFTIKLVFCEEFPAKPPKGLFVSRIFHPNVSREGEICVNTLKRDWKASCTLRHVLLVIRCLMIEPNPDSALNAEAGRLIQDNYTAFEEKARMFTEIHAKAVVTQKAAAVSEQLTTESDSSSKENINSLNNASTSTSTTTNPTLTTSSVTATKKSASGLKSSALLVKKTPATKVAAKNDTKKKALNRL
jgi:ubiquitin-conjugating enzyme E2 S